MALTKAQLEALKNSLLASQQPIIASTHRELIQNVIDEMYDAQSRGNLLAGVQQNETTTTGDTLLLIRSGQAFLVPTSLFTEIAGDFSVIRFGTQVTENSTGLFAKLMETDLSASGNYAIILSYAEPRNTLNYDGSGAQELRVSFTVDESRFIIAETVQIVTSQGSSVGEFVLYQLAGNRAAIYHRSNHFFGRIQFRIVFQNSLIPLTDFVNNAPYQGEISFLARYGSVSVVGVSDGRYLRKDVDQTTDAVIDILKRLYVGNPSAGLKLIAYNIIKAQVGASASFQVYNSLEVLQLSVGNRILIPSRIHIGFPSDAGNNAYNFIRATGGIQPTLRIEDGLGVIIATFEQGGRNIAQGSRSSAFDRLIRRDEQRLFYLSTITTAGAVNNQSLTAGIFNYRFTAATSITGFTLGEIGLSIIIQNQTGTTLTLVHESGSSLEANRLRLIGAANLVIPIDGKATLIYCTGNRWELLSKNFDFSSIQ
jgi:hypothetical protein